MEPGPGAGLVVVGEDPKQGGELRADSAQPALVGDGLAVLDQLTYPLEQL
jgi:hypothetical protein